MSQPTHAEAEACFDALHDGVPPAEEMSRWMAQLGTADLGDPLVVSALELLQAANLGQEIPGPASKTRGPAAT